LLELSGFPVPGQEFTDALGRMIGQPLQDIGQPGTLVDVVELCGLKQVRAWKVTTISSVSRQIKPTND